MSKKQLTEQEKNERKLKNLAKFYDYASSELNLTGDEVEDVHNLVMKCVDIQHEICSNSDSIKIDDYEKVKELTEIDKQTYLEFVRICALKNNDKLHEKAIKKFESDFENRLLNTNLRYSFLNSFMGGDDIKITDNSKEQFEKFEDYISEKFNTIIEDSTKKREYINLVLRREYSKYQKAAMYISKLELTPADFKELVDYEVYKNGCYPSPTSPSKVWAIFNKYSKALRLMKKYNFNQHENLNKEFGLNVELITQHPVEHPWMNNSLD